jgi:cell division protein FtsB
MRHRKPTVAASFSRWTRTLPLTRETVLFLIVVAAAAWMGWALVQEVGLTHQLSQQIAQLRQQDASIQASNQQYRRDIAGVSSGATAEQDARSDGYARAGEKVYVVGTPPPTTPPVWPGRTVSANPLTNLWNWLSGVGS